MGDTMRVTAPLVVARTKNGRVVNLYRDDVVTEDISDASVEHLRDLGFIAGDEPVPLEGNGRPDGEPAGNASLDAWQAYALTKDGVTVEDIDGKTRDELREQFKS